MENYEQSRESNKCQYWLVMESCRQCLFETLCRLDKEKFLDKKNKEDDQNKNTMWGIH